MDWELALKILGVLQSIGTLIVLGTGAWWFFIRRQRYPRSAITHTITHWPVMDTNKTILHVVLSIENKGEVLIRLDDICVRVYVVRPWPDEVLLPVSEGRDPVYDNETEVDWPLAAKREIRSTKSMVEIEPGELDEIPFDFALDSINEVVIIYSHVGNKIKGDKTGWSKSTTYTLVADSQKIVR